jgi:hypothetical protein
MKCANRRLERRNDVINKIKEKSQNYLLHDFSIFEKEDKILEGTGSLVLDKKFKKAYLSM